MLCGIIITQCFCAHSAFAATRFVKEGSSGGGTSWSDAYGDLKTAITNAVAFDEIRVASGTYRAGLSSFDTFDLPNAVVIIGGYVAAFDGDTSRDPDPFTNNTVLSGDLGGGLSSDVIVSASNVDLNTELRGFRITGAAVHAIEVTGGSEALFADLLIDDNTDFLFGLGGAGMYIVNSAIRVENTHFISNRTANSGGALYCTGSVQPEFLSCRFWDNSADDIGGAVLIQNSLPRFENTDFFENFTESGTAGAAMVVHNGGVTETDATLVITDCLFAGNHSLNQFNLMAGQGGAVPTANKLIRVSNMPFRPLTDSITLSKQVGRTFCNNSKL
jgi:predicted outer membrane repeat protein